jgi:hypothetical protein
VFPVDAVLWVVFLLTLPVLSLLVVGQWAFQVLARKRGFIPPDKVSWVERRWVIRSAAGCLALYAACFAYGAFVEAGWVRTTVTEIDVDRPVLGYARFRIVHLSDLHLERFGGRERRLLEAVAGAAPHIIVLTGDYMNVREGGPALVEVLKNLKAPHGVFGVEGNWDSKFPVRRLFEAGGATLMEDETRLIEHAGHRLRLVGQGLPPDRPLGELLGGLEDEAFTVFLHHTPDAAEDLQARGPGRRVDLFLCGHTHGGQVRLPLWGAIVTLTRNHKKYEQGLYKVGDVPMYVNRGVGLEGGAVPPVRFLARPEVAVLDLVYRPKDR